MRWILYLNKIIITPRKVFYPFSSSIPRVSLVILEFHGTTHYQYFRLNRRDIKELTP